MSEKNTFVESFLKYEEYKPEFKQDDSDSEGNTVEIPEALLKKPKQHRTFTKKKPKKVKIPPKLLAPHKSKKKKQVKPGKLKLKEKWPPKGKNYFVSKRDIKDKSISTTVKHIINNDLSKFLNVKPVSKN